MTDTTSVPLTALAAVSQGGVIVYPTEAVYGLGCDPDNQQAVERLLAIKQRPAEKGLILIADNYGQLLKYVDDAKIPMDKRADIFSSWPGAITWVMPAAKGTPKWLTGQFDSIAVRVTNHPTVKRLCQELGKPLVSTSANLSGHDTVTSIAMAKSEFGELVAFYVDEPLGGNTQPSTIKDVMTGKVFRG
ncbi:L-threonylcarbamoyladenylate synthase [Pseudoalteromonas sp. SG44-17]|uniref:L-threonylcarbamoyladenylate synthase n=1 Tax=Pseudoalteromonas sp. SG44-17 TaxID=2760963 RepID=UPI0016040201|nr:L-threonylcarbamoyladenylate synthase [Pseudoalteromonas sp. SG44-17]MBB1410514.1 threonylcarbamoyl-AMP synthase [Pseudoalteromonas sp. SG44-17]